MGHTTIAPNGTISFRTKLMTSDQAAGFAKCVKANSRFCDVAICESKARNGKQFVEFRPANIERQRDMYQAEYDKREQRAADNLNEFIFWKDPDASTKYWCFSVQSGETYELFPGSCSCPDHHYRCEKAALICKHRHALQMQIDAGILGKTDKVTRRFDYKTERNYDFS